MKIPLPKNRQIDISWDSKRPLRFNRSYLHNHFWDITIWKIKIGYYTIPF